MRALDRGAGLLGLRLTVSGEKVIAAGERPEAWRFTACGAVEVRLASRRIRLGSSGFFGALERLAGRGGADLLSPAESARAAAQ